MERGGKGKSPVRVFRGRGHIIASKTVSRVLYLTVIYLGASLPVRSSHLLRTAGPACLSSHGVAPDRVYSIGQSPADGWALTPPFHPYPAARSASSPTKCDCCQLGLPALSSRDSGAVSLCCTFPEVAFGGRYPLSLPCGARTFLMNGLSACPRDRLSSSPVYFTG